MGLIWEINHFNQYNMSNSNAISNLLLDSKSTKESKTIVFKPEFEEKLKKLGIKKQFVKNYLKEDKWEGADISLAYGQEQFNQAEDWYHFILWAFYWRNTPEGDSFWSLISVE